MTSSKLNFSPFSINSNSLKKYYSKKNFSTNKSNTPLNTKPLYILNLNSLLESEPQPTSQLNSESKTDKLSLLPDLMLKSPQKDQQESIFTSLKLE